MSASLVGSEMCIRDSRTAMLPRWAVPMRASEVTGCVFLFTMPCRSMSCPFLKLTACVPVSASSGGQ
eukprot:3887656-Alexandrium_andersonii.AAC.1